MGIYRLDAAAGPFPEWNSSQREGRLKIWSAVVTGLETEVIDAPRLSSHPLRVFFPPFQLYLRGAWQNTWSVQSTAGSDLKRNLVLTLVPGRLASNSAGLSGADSFRRASGLCGRCL